MTSTIERALAETLLALTRIASPIGEEKALCDAIEARFLKSLGTARMTRTQHSLVVRIDAEERGGPRVGLVGHLDTVRTEHEGEPRIEGDRLFGPGAADMKAGLAVMIELAERTSPSKLACDLTLVFYEREEGPYEENMLGPLLEQHEDLRKLDLAICLEPSDNKLQLGCMGSLHATVLFTGKTAHSARPWQGENAITKAAPFLAELDRRAPRDVTVDGLLYREVLCATLATGGRGRNVVPDRFELNVNCRFAPGTSVEQATAEIERTLAGCGAITVHDASPAGRPHATHPLVERLVRCGVDRVESKQAWTDVARFDAVGVTAVNFGPGTQAQAHQRNEYTDLPQLIRGYTILERFVREHDILAACAAR